ncbi:MAG: hypothetical protein R2818_09340 [Flavobacteriales bacterium]
MQLGRNIDTTAKFHRAVLLAAIVVHGITAWFSSGYHSADEHFQIIAFAQAAVGELPIEHLPWEYATGIRSSFQPWVAVSVFKIAGAFGISDPFTRTLLLRSLTAFLALFAMHRFVRATLEQVPTSFRKVYIILTYFLWFLPFLHVRFSSEGWSAIFLLIGLTELLRNERHVAWRSVTGIAFGFAMLCRPPVGLIVLSGLAWLLFIRKDGWRSVGMICAGILFALGIGLGLDSAFYSEPTWSLGRYLHMGFGGDPQVRFDTLPWWYYLPWVVKYAIPPIGICMLAAFSVLVVRSPKHLLVWCILPYLIVHSIIPHKELRFLYPLADLMPLMLILGSVKLREWIPAPSYPTVGIAVTLVFGLSNVSGLLVVTTNAAGIGRTRIAATLDQQTTEGAMIAYVIEPAEAWRISLPAFYLPAGMRDTAFTVDTFPNASLQVEYLVAQDPDAERMKQRIGGSMDLICSTEPAWASELMRWYTWGEGPGTWRLYRIGAEGP